MISLAWSVSAVGPVIVFSGAAAVYLLLSLVAGARLAVSRLAAERLEDESGLPEGLDFDSRAWSAMEFVRHMALVASGAAAVFGPWHQPGFLPATGVGVLLILLGRVLVALIVPRAPEGLLRMAVPALALLDRTVGALLMPLARTHESLAARHRRHRASEDEDAREEQFEEVIRDAEEEGLIEAEQTELMREIADVGDAVAREVMTPPHRDRRGRRRCAPRRAGAHLRRVPPLPVAGLRGQPRPYRRRGQCPRSDGVRAGLRRRRGKRAPRPGADAARQAGPGGQAGTGVAQGVSAPAPADRHRGGRVRRHGRPGDHRGPARGDRRRDSRRIRASGHRDPVRRPGGVHRRGPGGDRRTEGTGWSGRAGRRGRDSRRTDPLAPGPDPAGGGRAWRWRA
ncbi:MAG: hypothetical protein Q9Q13_10805 [Acidobacteriota bacterium]|nr:hypothetical protein [Acidobacteriota bacterium]